MWNKFEASVNEEETLGASFYSNGLFKISNEVQSSKDPKVKALLQNGKIIMCIDKSLILLEDESSMNFNFLSFGSSIDCFSVAKSGELIVCCLSDGNVHGVHIKGVPLFNLTIEEEDIRSENSFQDINQINDDYFLLLTNGRIYKLSNVEEKMLSDSMLSVNGNDTCIMNETYLKNATLECLTKTKFPKNVYSFCRLLTCDGELFVVAGENFVYLINTENKDSFISISYLNGIQRITHIFNLDNFILGLTETGQLVEICPYSQRMFKSTRNWDKKIEDLIVLEATEDYIELLSLSTSNEHKERKMEIVEFPKGEVKYELTMPEVTWLVSQPKSSVNMYYVAGEKNSDGFVQTVEMKSISETDPAQRLKKLILKGYLDEAEKFAKEFDLDVEPIHEARVKRIILGMSSLGNNRSLIETKFEILMTLLSKIKNQNFLVEIRLIEIPERSLMTKFLEYLLNNIDTNKFAEQTNEINELLLRLETLRLIDPDECNMEWQKFLYHKSLFHEAKDYFKNDVLLSNLIWSRHASSIIPNIEIGKFREWLYSIPNSVEAFQIIQWLKHFAPCFLQVYPNEMNTMVDWSLDRTRSLQFSNLWPEVGLEFINNIMSIFTAIKFMFIDFRQSYSKNIDKIQFLKFTLEELSVLKKTYNLTLTMDDYVKESIEETAFRLLQRIQIQNFKKIVNDFLYPIFNEKGMVPESVIIRYIKFLCANRILGFWQERAVIAVELLNNEEEKLKCALQVLKVSPVPWSDAVNPLIKLGRSSSHPLANDIYIEYKSQSLKMIKVKYNWQCDYFNLYHDKMKLVFRILKTELPEMVQDIQSLVESTPDIAHDAYFYLINKLTELGDLESCMEVVKQVNEDIAKDLLESTVHKFLKRIDDETIEGEELPNFLEVIKLLENQLKLTANEVTYKDVKRSIENVRMILLLRKKFKFTITVNCLKDHSLQDKYFQEGIDILIEKLRSKKGNLLHDIWCDMKILIDCFQMSFVGGLYQLCLKVNNLYFTCGVVDSIIESFEIEKDDYEFVLKFAVFLFVQQSNHFKENVPDESYDPLAFPLIDELLKRILPDFNVLLHDQLFELIRWADIGKSFYKMDVLAETRSFRIVDEKIFECKNKLLKIKQRENRRESFSIFEQIDESKAKNMNHKSPDAENIQMVLKCVCNALKLLIYGMGMNTGVFLNLRQHFGEVNEIQSIKDEFFQSLENLLKHKLHSPVSTIIQYILKHQEKTKKVVVPLHFVNTLNKKIIKFILSQKEPDFMEAFLIFKSDVNQEDCLDYLETAMKNNSQKVAYSTFLEMYNVSKGNITNVSGERENRLKFYYYTELCKQDPAIKYKMNLENVSVVELVKELKNHILSTDLLKRMSKDFDWDYQLLLVQQIKKLLFKQELEFEIKTDVFGKDEVIVKSSVESIKKMCQPYLNEISNSNLLASKMKQYFFDTNSYFYELYLCILDILDYSSNLSHDQKLYQNILLFLKHKMTQKRRRIGQFETDFWLNSQTEVGVMPNISKFRLPFKLLIEQELNVILNDEIYVDNYEKWLPLIRLHSTLKKLNMNESQEYFCMSAVKNSINEYKSMMDVTDSDKWNLKPVNNAFLQSVLRLTHYMTDKAKIMYILYFITNHAPEGCDQVEAAYECYKFVVRNEEELLANPKSSEVVIKIKRKYPIVKTQHLLHLYGLVDEKLFQLVENPVELINALYHHDSILQPQKKDINKLAIELAQIYNINLVAQQMRLLQKWLAFTHNSSHEADMDETVYEDYITSNQDQDSDDSTNDEFVVRAYYILSNWSDEDAMNFLAGQLSVSTNTENQLQLYECFAKLVDDNTAYIDLVNPNDFLLLKCCYYLKNLGFTYTTERFVEINKLDLLKKVWASHFNNPKALELMCLICLGFEIYLPQIWNGVLKQMVSLNMTSHLSILVEILSTKSQLLTLSHLKSAWETVIREPFLSATKTQSFDQEMKLAKSLVLLQKCPISTYLNLIDFAEHCLRLDRPHMAAFFVAFVKDGDREKLVKMLEPFCDSNFKKDIIDLEDLGVTPIITKSVIDSLKL